MKLIAENKIDKLDLLKKLRDGEKGMLEDIADSQFNDVLLDEHILGEESVEDD
jgi:hypothetical protein